MFMMFAEPTRLAALAGIQRAGPPGALLLCARADAEQTAKAITRQLGRQF